MADEYDVTVVTVKPGTHPKALVALGKTLTAAADLLACWYSEMGALNQIMIIRKIADAAAIVEARLAVISAKNPFGIGELITELAMDTYVSFDFLPAMRPGKFGPYYEVRTYMLKPGGLAPTIDLWRKAVPGRTTVSTLLAAMTSTTGTMPRFVHIWPYQSLDERARLRDGAIADGLWPPPGGPGHLVSQQADIFLPASFSPTQ